MACGRCGGHQVYEDSNHRMTVCMDCNPLVPNPPGKKEPEPKPEPKDKK